MRQGISKRQFTLLTGCLVMPMSVYAAAAGFYMGLSTGPASNTGGTQEAQTAIPPPATTPVTPRTNQWGSRLFMGYQVNSYAGFEGALTYFSSINYDDKGVETCNGANAHVRDFEFLGKGQMPFNNFDVFGKAGVAVTYLTTSGSLNPDSSRECGLSTNQVMFRPAVSVGASYDLSPNWVADVSWTRIMVGNIVSNVDYFGVGISYHFVNRYCGQFLCD